MWNLPHYDVSFLLQVNPGRLVLRLLDALLYETSALVLVLPGTGLLPSLINTKQ